MQEETKPQPFKTHTHFNLELGFLDRFRLLCKRKVQVKIINEFDVPVVPGKTNITVTVDYIFKRRLKYNREINGRR